MRPNGNERRGYCAPASTPDEDAESAPAEHPSEASSDVPVANDEADTFGLYSLAHQEVPESDVAKESGLVHMANKDLPLPTATPPVRSAETEEEATMPQADEFAERETAGATLCESVTAPELTLAGGAGCRTNNRARRRIPCN